MKWIDPCVLVRRDWMHCWSSASRQCRETVDWMNVLIYLECAAHSTSSSHQLNNALSHDKSNSSYGGGGGSSAYGAAPPMMGGGSNFSNSNLGGTLHSIDFSSQQLIPFEKDFYIEHPDVSKRPETEAQAWRASKQIVIVGEGIPKPCMTFEEASMPEYVLSEGTCSLVYSL